MTLADLFAKFSCSDNSPIKADPWVAFFQYLGGMNSRPDLTAEFAEYAKGLSTSPEFKPPWASTVDATFDGKTLEGLGILPGFLLDEDGIIHIHFPGYGERSSSEAIVNDFRILVLARLLLAFTPYEYATQPVIIEVHYPGHKVQGNVKNSTWGVLGRAITGFMGDRKRTPGNFCLNCSRRDSCAPFQDYANRPGMEVEETTDKSDMGQKLYLALVMAQTQEETLRERRKVLLKRFIALADEGKVRVGELFKMRVKAEDSDKFPFGQVHNLLSIAGLWDDKYGRIDVRELKKAIKSMPPEVQERLGRMKFTETREFDVREVLEGASNEIRTAPFRGISL